MKSFLSSGRLQFLLLAALFVAPLLSATLIYFFFPEWVPTQRSNYGELVSPARPLPLGLDLRKPDGSESGEGTLRGHWTYVYLGGASCEAACTARLEEIRQVRTLLNEKRPRVRRVYIAPDLAAARAAQAQLGPGHPDLLVVAAADGGIQRFFAPTDPQALYLIDPLGNWMMVYAADTEPRGLLKDIKLLLRVSQIG
ncbi:MAG TPA: hypothetical protein VFV11_06495 [Solimonas sp.]|nr:hypothetical protein [Solimonas sp.]